MYPYIPFGKLTSLEGDPGVGKSTVALALAASVSTGKGYPAPSDIDSQHVLLVSAEDGLADTVRPRLEKMGADLTRIHAIEDSLDLHEKGFTQLREALDLLDAALVILDPLVAFLGDRVDINRANETRKVMAQLAQIAADHNTAIPVIRHLTKASQLKAIYRAQGNIDITAACRSALLAGCNSQDPNERAIFHIKSNLAPNGKPMGYRLEGGAVIWTGESHLSVRHILTEAQYEDLSAIDEAIEFLQDELKDGPIEASRVFADTKELQIAEKTCKRAKKKLGVITTREGQSGKRGGGQFYWSLPEKPVDDLGGQVSKHDPLDPLNHFSFKMTEPTNIVGPLNSFNNHHWEEA